MEQVIFGGYYNILHATNTEYNTVAGGIEWNNVEARRAQLVSADGIIKNLRVKLSGAPTAGKHYDFTLMVNGAPSALTLEIADAATSGNNMVNEIDVAPGDAVSIECDPDNGPTAVYATWTCMFEGDTANESLILGYTNDILNNTTTEYIQLMSSGDNSTATENDHREVVPTAGTLKDFYVKLNIDPGTAPDAYRFTVRLNGASPIGGLVVTITANDTTGSDLVNDIDVVAGDILTMMVEPLNSPSATPWPVSWGVTFVADTDGESIVPAGSPNNLHGTNTEYYFLGGSTTSGAGTWDTNENRRYQLGQVCTLKNLYVLLSNAPGVGNDRDFAIRINGTNVVTLQISDAATTGNSGALSDTVALDEYVGLRTIPNSSPSGADAYWGFVCYIAPPAAGWTGKISGVTDPAEIAGVAVANIAEVKGVA